MSRRKNRRSPTQSRRRYYLLGGVVVAAIVGYLLVSGALQGQGGTSQTASQQTSASETTTASQPIILYVNQGNGVVNGSNFGTLLETANSHGFNTIFFQIYRSGTLLFNDSSLSQFVASAHGQGLKIFFALYFTDSTQKIPSSIYADGEDGINLDMSTLPIAFPDGPLRQPVLHLFGEDRDHDDRPHPPSEPRPPYRRDVWRWERPVHPSWDDRGRWSVRDFEPSGLHAAVPICARQ